MKNYVFNSVIYNDLDSLGKAYANNYADGIKDIFTNTKKLLSFVKSNTSDKKMPKRIVDYLVYSKYKNNALTFVIFELLNEKKVFINGVELSFKDFCNQLKENSDPENILFRFLEDRGLSKTYAKLNIDNLNEDAAFIEADYDKKFTYKFLSTYYDYQKESIYDLLNTLNYNAPDIFDRFNDFITTASFMINLAHLSFKHTIAAVKAPLPIFKIVELLYIHNENYEERLRLALNNTYYFWLLDHLYKYKAKNNEAKALFNEFKNLKAEFKSMQNKANKKTNGKIPFLVFNDINASLFKNYLLFVKLYNEGFIVLKNVDDTQYLLNMEYDTTLVCEAYLNEANITLGMQEAMVNEEEKENADSEVETIDPVADKIEPVKEEVEEEAIVAAEKIELEQDEVFNDKYELETIKKTKKCNDKNKTFASYAIFFGVFNLIIIAVLAVVPTILINSLGDNLGNVKPIVEKLMVGDINQSIIYLIIAGVAMLIIIVLGIVLKVLSGKTNNKLIKLLFIKNALDKDQLEPEFEKKLEELSVNYDDFIKYKKKRYNVLASFVGFFQAVSAAVLALFMMIIIAHFVPTITLGGTTLTINGTPMSIQTLGNFVFYLAAFATPLVAFGLLLIKRKKAKWYMLVLDILVMAGAMAIYQFIKF